jgi:adenosylcobinamide-GDP ribazoletransferase
MKDPHLGTFGLVGGMLLLLGKFVALQSVVRGFGSGAGVVICIAVTISRCLVLCVAANAPYPRQEGTGKALIEATTWKEAAIFAVVAAGIAWFTSSYYSYGELAITLFVCPFLAIMFLRWICQRRLGGITGDCLGAAIELCEVVCLMSAAIAKNVG